MTTDYYEVDVCDEYRSKTTHLAMTAETLVRYCQSLGLGVIVERKLEFDYGYPKLIPFAIPAEEFVSMFSTTEEHYLTSYGMSVGGPGSTFLMPRYIEVIPFSWNKRFDEDIKKSINY